MNHHSASGYVLFLNCVLHSSVYGGLFESHSLLLFCCMYLDFMFASNFDTYDVPDPCLVFTVTIRRRLLVTTENEFDSCQC
jgi:hypothetical protein